MEKRKTLTLYELNGLVRSTIETTLSREYWVEAELMEARESRGHCYMSLVQKDEKKNVPVAQASAKCWMNTWQLVKPYFERVTGQKLCAGLKVLLKVYAQFHENYGFSWIVTDIDPTFTLGDMARKRQEIIRQLKEEGVYGLQRELSLPVFCQHIAVISSATAAGYGDFVNQLQNNEFGYQFTTRLFPALMQGEQVEQSVIAALEQIYAVASKSEESVFDCVVIIRGGGSTSDLSGFDTLALAEHVANFPLPIITGIGHERDESILDLVSYTSVKTPTAAAAFLIDHLKRTDDFLSQAQQRIGRIARLRMEKEQLRLARLSSQIPSLFSVVRQRQENKIDRLYTALLTAAQRRLTEQQHQLQMIGGNIRPMVERQLLHENHRLQLLEQRAKALDPTLLLQRGYSITLKDGKAVKDARVLQAGDEIETRLAQGSVHSVVH